MKSELTFVMHPLDEAAFARQVLADPMILLIDGPRWQQSTPRTTRALETVSGSYCIVWSPDDMPFLTARYIEARGDWYCNSEYATLQFLRSTVDGAVILQGRLAVGTAPDCPGLSTHGAHALEQRYKGLCRFLKKHYTNSVIRWCNPTAPIAPAGPHRSSNPSKLDPLTWVGPAALSWLQEDDRRVVKQAFESSVEGRLAFAG